MQPRAAIAAIRFGLRRRAGEPVPGDPEAWLTGQLRAAPLPEKAPDLPDFAGVAAAFAEDRNDWVALAAAEPPPGQAMARTRPATDGSFSSAPSCRLGQRCCFAAGLSGRGAARGRIPPSPGQAVPFAIGLLSHPPGARVSEPAGLLQPAL
jgi:hypothetical protein